MKKITSNMVMLLAISQLLLTQPLAGQTVPPSPAIEAINPAAEQATQPKLPVEVLDATPHLPGMPSWIVLLTILAISIPLAAVVFSLLKKEHQKSPSKKEADPFAETTETLLQLRKLAAEKDLPEIATEISLALRHYLAQSQADSALYQTREEFVTDEDRLHHISEPVKSETADFLSELAALQYAPPTSDPERGCALVDESFIRLNRLTQRDPDFTPTSHAPSAHD